MASKIINTWSPMLEDGDNTKEKCDHIYGMHIVDVDHDDINKLVGFLVYETRSISDPDDVKFTFCPLCGVKLDG